jgi:hypothetical protein
VWRIWAEHGGKPDTRAGTPLPPRHPITRPRLRDPSHHEINDIGISILFRPVEGYMPDRT